MTLNSQWWYDTILKEYLDEARAQGPATEQCGPTVADMHADVVLYIKASRPDVDVSSKKVAVAMTRQGSEIVGYYMKEYQE